MPFADHLIIVGARASVRFLVSEQSEGRDPPSLIHDCGPLRGPLPWPERNDPDAMKSENGDHVFFRRLGLSEHLGHTIPSVIILLFIVDELLCPA